METPWHTEAGRAARRAQLRLLAQDKGEVGEFAREVLEGRASYRDVLYASILDDRQVGAALANVEAWTRLPQETREALVADSDRATEELIAELNAQPPKPPPEDDEQGPILSDAW